MTIYEIIARVLDAFGCMIVLAFWIGFWFWFLTRKDSRTSPDGRKAIGSPLTGNGGGQFIHKVEQDENERLADMAESR